MKLEALGWESFFSEQFKKYAEKDLFAARVVLQHKNTYHLYSEFGEIAAETSGKLRFEAKGRDDLPTVGDWVAMQYLESESKGIIQAVLPRKSKFLRKVAGETTDVQVLASNIDTVFLVSGLDNDFNVRRLERYLTVAWESGASPVILLNKTDLCSDVDDKIAQVEAVAFGVPVVAISAKGNENLSPISEYLGAGETAVLLGSSGVGKSTIINRLIGEEIQEVRDVREDDSRGRHTTSHRELFLLENGSMIIDTPGLREIQLWEGGEGIQEAFDDIEVFAKNCRFRNCSHLNEPGCEVKKAIAEGELSQARYESYQKLQKELAYVERLQDQRSALEEKRRTKILTKMINRMDKDRE